MRRIILNCCLEFYKSEVELLYELLCWAVEANKIQYFNADGADVDKLLEKLEAEIKEQEVWIKTLEK